MFLSSHPFEQVPSLACLSSMTTPPKKVRKERKNKRKSEEKKKNGMCKCDLKHWEDSCEKYFEKGLLCCSELQEIKMELFNLLQLKFK